MLDTHNMLKHTSFVRMVNQAATAVGAFMRLGSESVPHKTLAALLYALGCSGALG